MSVADTNPYPWPYDGAVDPARLALLIIAGQSFFTEQSAGSADVLATTLTCAEAVRAAGGLVVFTRHGVPDRPAIPVSRPGTHLPLVDSDGWSLVVDPAPGDAVVDTVGHSAFFGSDLDSLLRSVGRSQLLMAGFAAEVNVDCTLRTANDQGYECLVLVDAYAPLDRSTGDHTLSSVTMSGGIFGALGTSTNLLAALPVAADAA